jgi:hypothetical protein
MYVYNINFIYVYIFTVTWLSPVEELSPFKLAQIQVLSLLALLVQ